MPGKARVTANRTKSGRCCLLAIIRGTSEGEGSGAAKLGAALLSGLLRCGRCGRKLQVVYSGTSGRVPRYVCRGDRGDRESSRCLTAGSLRVDRAVVQSVLTAIQPAGIEAAVKLTECAQVEDDEKRKALELALERVGVRASPLRRAASPSAV